MADPKVLITVNHSGVIPFINRRGPILSNISVPKSVADKLKSMGYKVIIKETRKAPRPSTPKKVEASIPDAPNPGAVDDVPGGIEPAEEIIPEPKEDEAILETPKLEEVDEEEVDEEEVDEEEVDEEEVDEEEVDEEEVDEEEVDEEEVDEEEVDLSLIEAMTKKELVAYAAEMEPPIELDMRSTKIEMIETVEAALQ